MGDEDQKPPRRRPPAQRRTRLGRRKQPVLGRRAKPPGKGTEDQGSAERKSDDRGSGDERPADKGSAQKGPAESKPPAREPKAAKAPKRAERPARARKSALSRASKQNRKPKPSSKPKPTRKPKPRRKPRPRPASTPEADSRREVISRRISAVVILLGIAVVVMALTDAAPFFDDVTEEQRVEETVQRFFAATGERDFETVCSLFSPEVAQAIKQVGATETKKNEVQGCPGILAARFAAADGEQTMLDVKIESVRVSGPRAVADVIVKSEQAPKGQSVPVELERGPSGWLIARQVITN